MQVARRIRRTPAASVRKFCDLGIIIAVLTGSYYVLNRDWSKYSDALKLRLDNYTVWVFIYFCLESRLWTFVIP